MTNDPGPLAPSVPLPAPPPVVGPPAAAPEATRPRLVRTRLATLLASHLVVDVYAAFVPPLLGVLEVRCRLDPAQTAWLLGIGSVSSGLSQPLSAWLADRLDSRLFGAAGLLLAAVCLSCIGWAESFPGLVGLFVLGMIGVGIYHPVGASTAGQLCGPRRSMGLSIFFVAGMAGGITGSLLAPYLTGLPRGFDLLRYAMVPGLLVAVALHVAIGAIPHRHDRWHPLVPDRAEARRRWSIVGLLYASNALRFTVNMALFYLYVRWAQAPVAAAHPGWSERQIAAAAAPINGALSALTVAGMAVGGLVAGATIRAGREKWPMIFVPILFAPAIALFPLAGAAAGYGLALLAGIGFAAMIPVTLSLSQRLLPHRTSLVSGLMLGGAWTLAMAGPALAERTVDAYGQGPAFAGTATLLALAGLVCLPLGKLNTER